MWWNNNAIITELDAQKNRLKSFQLVLGVIEEKKDKKTSDYDMLKNNINSNLDNLAELNDALNSSRYSNIHKIKFRAKKKSGYCRYYREN
jgi:predicted alpha/beta superfamily hydrolase